MLLIMSRLKNLCFVLTLAGAFSGVLAGRAQDAQKPARVRVSQGVAEKNILKKVPPKYPQEARRNFIQGTVMLEAVIAKDGSITNLRVMSGNPLLAASALDAVKKWRYRPYMLNGEPVDVETTIKIDFHM